jgi:predicted glycosyltransferase involved in capsule biosynthesis
MSVENNPQQYEKMGEVYEGRHVGSSQFSICSSALASAGGWDEGFVGYGLEDVELNLRLDGNEVETVMAERCPIFHLWHDRDERWHNYDVMRKNYRHFDEAKVLSFPALLMGPEFGVFPTPETTA